MRVETPEGDSARASSGLPLPNEAGQHEAVGGLDARVWASSTARAWPSWMAAGTDTCCMCAYHAADAQTLRQWEGIAHGHGDECGSEIP
jgi:hypothetical protein